MELSARKRRVLWHMLCVSILKQIMAWVLPALLAPKNKKESRLVPYILLLKVLMALSPAWDPAGVPAARITSGWQYWLLSTYCDYTSWESKRVHNSTPSLRVTRRARAVLPGGRQ